MDLQGADLNPAVNPIHGGELTNPLQSTVVLTPIKRSRGGQRMIGAPTPEQPRGGAHDPAIRPLLDDGCRPRQNAMALDLRNVLIAGCGRELARRGRWIRQIRLVRHEGWLALSTASSRPGKRCSSSSV